MGPCKGIVTGWIAKLFGSASVAINRIKERWILNVVNFTCVQTEN